MNRIFTIIFCIILVGACSDENPNVIYNIEKEYRVEMKEVLSPESQLFALDIESIKLYTCEETQIDALHTNDEGIFKTELNGINLPDECEEEGTFSAKKTISIDELSTGAFPFEVNLGKSIINSGTLYINEDYYELVVENDLKGIEINKERLNKIKNGMIWVRLELDEVNLAILNDLRETLEDFGMDNYPNALTGNYFYFNIDENRNLSINRNSEFSYTSDFLMVYNGNDIDNVSFLIQNFINEWSTLHQLDVDVFTYQGKEY